MKKIIAVLTLMTVVLTTGCAHQHKFSDATCTEPQKCAECGETQGEALGHDIEFGICGKCGTAVGLDDLNKIIELTIHSPNRTSASGYFDAKNYSTCYEYLLELQNDYSKAIEIAEKYPEMSNLSSMMKEIEEMKLEKSNGSSGGNIVFMSDYMKFLTAELKLYDEFEILQKKLGL
ncbi:MAG: hypothetical protein J6C38_00890 [Oscillospiraceae bacterium]|nr:hypothetical protein [Oscillospiraceae bacterium]